MYASDQYCVAFFMSLCIEKAAVWFLAISLNNPALALDYSAITDKMGRVFEHPVKRQRSH